MASTSAGSSRKRKLDVDDDYSGGIQQEMNKFMHSSKRKHTMDSDEEEDDDDEKYNKKKYSVMHEDEIEGQEAATEDFDGETRITPFNMKDELEEGYFDGSGMYIWNKKAPGEIKDSWLDSIDWMKVKQNQGETEVPSRRQVLSSSDDDSNAASLEESPISLYEKVLKLLIPGESILKAIKRLGGGKQLSASEKLKQKKLARLRGESMDQTEAQDSTNDQKKMAELTDLANEIMKVSGNMDVYGETYESLNHMVASSKKPPVEKQDIPKMAEDDGLDMFSDEYEKK